MSILNLVFPDNGQQRLYSRTIHIRKKERDQAQTQTAQDSWTPTQVPATVNQATPSGSSYAGRVGQKLCDWTGLSQIAEEAKQDMHRAPAPLPNDLNPVKDIITGIMEHPEQVQAQLLNPEVQDDLSKLGITWSGLVPKTLTSSAFHQASPEEQIGKLLSHLGVGTGKFCQIMASSEDLDPTIRRIFSTAKSNGAPSRTLSEAQNLIDRMYGENQYQLKTLAGVGTIGEVYLARTTTNDKPVVIKVLKDGITPDTLQAERRIAQRILELCYKDKPDKLNYQKNRVESLYQQWTQELDFRQEAEWAALLNENATRFKVAQTLQLGSLPGESKAISMVQECAPGISLDKLTQLIQAYKQNPTQYRAQYADLIKQHPWLAEPNTWMKQLPGLYRDALNEQTLLRVTTNKRWVSHGDPHAGNVFIHFNPQTQTLEPTFIDAGLTIVRDAKQAANDLGLALNSILGDSNNLANAVAVRANLEPGPQREQTIESLRTILDERLFKARVNLTDQRYNNQLMDHLMETYQLTFPPEETAFFKSQMQALMNYNELSHLVGQPENNFLKDSLADLALGSTKLLWHAPCETSQRFLSAGQHLRREGRDSIRCLCQFLLPSPPPEPVAGETRA